MIEIGNILVSDDVVEKQFVCDLAKCKGGCCEEGDAGAPLEDNEMDIINEIFEKVKPYLSDAAIAEIERKGKYVYHKEFGWVTPTLGDDSEICVYGYRDPTGIIKCGFEQAYYDGAISWKKPISCHLFPVIVSKGKQGKYERVNYVPREKLCSPACGLGKKLKVPVYEFLKEALIRKYGKEFYTVLNEVAKKKEKGEF
ncbi:MAG: hypothetical protein JWM28_3951 [Chitinophagaceae bacterium]|nr:hypothetical protein [Chitinophagaceae bacterium]